MPPARRPPSGQPTVTGAPVDPAIISSQLARPDTSPQQKQEETPKQNVSTPSTAKGPEVPQTQVESKSETPKETAPTAKGGCSKYFTISKLTFTSTECDSERRDRSPWLVQNLC